jgi:hypothetical protein
MMRFSFSLWESVDLLPERVQDSHTRQDEALVIELFFNTNLVMNGYAGNLF